MIRRALVLAAIALLPSCGSLGSFDTALSASGEIPGVIQPGPQFTAFASAGSTISEAMSSKGVSGFKSAMITSGTLSVPATDAADLHFITSFSVSVTAAGLPTTVIAQQTGSAFAADPASGSVTLTIVPNVELKPYINAGGASFVATMPTQGHPAFNVPVTVDLNLHVQVL